MVFLYFTSHYIDVLFIRLMHRLVLQNVILQVVANAHRVREFSLVLQDKRDVVFECIDVFRVLRQDFLQRL